MSDAPLTYQQIERLVLTLPLHQRMRLLGAVLGSLQTITPELTTAQPVAAAQLLGMSRDPDRPALSDDQLQDDYVYYLERKYC